MFKKLFVPLIAAASLSLAGCMAMPADLNLAPDRVTAHSKYQVRLLPVAEPVQINQLHAWEIRLQSPSGQAITGAQIAVGGGMPQHGHGFPTKPRVTRELGDGRYLLEGMKFSMPGWWEIKLRIDGSAGRDEVTFNTIIAAGPALPPLAANRLRP